MQMINFLGWGKRRWFGGVCFCLRLANHKEIEVDSGLVKGLGGWPNRGEMFLDVVKLGGPCGRVEMRAATPNARMLKC
jgi:hypothetical protein